MTIFELAKKLYDTNIRMEIGMDVTHDSIKVRFKKDICEKTYCMNAIMQNVNDEDLFTHELIYYLEKFLKDCTVEVI